MGAKLQGTEASLKEPEKDFYFRFELSTDLETKPSIPIN